MIDLDERLDRASAAVRSQVNRMPVRQPTEVARNHRRSRNLTVASGFAAIAVLVFASSFIFNGADRDVAGQPADPIPAHTYTIDLPGWNLVGVWEAEDSPGRSHTLFDDEGSTAEALRRVMIDIGSAATDRGETLMERGIHPIDTIALYGSEATLYKTKADPELGWATVIATWTGPEEEQVAVLFEGISLDEAKSLLTGLTPLDLQEWQSLTSSYEPPVTTTISS